MNKVFCSIKFILASMVLLLAFASCQNSSGAQDGANTQGNSNTKPVFYFDPNTQSFKGSVTWQAKTQNEIILCDGGGGYNTFVQGIYWSLTPYGEEDPYFYGWVTGTGAHYAPVDDITTMTINKQNHTVTSTLEVPVDEDSEFSRRMVKWAEVPTTKLEVWLVFIAGSTNPFPEIDGEILLATQYGYGDGLSECGMINSWNYGLVWMISLVATESSPLFLYSNTNGRLGIDKALKMKSAKLEVLDQGANVTATHTAVIPWDDEEFLQKYRKDHNGLSIPFIPEMTNWGYLEKYRVAVTFIDGTVLTWEQ